MLPTAAASKARRFRYQEKGEGNRKKRKPLSIVAYVEAANFAIRHSPRAKSFYQRKCAKTKKVVAIKALANKLARPRSTFYVTSALLTRTTLWVTSSDSAVSRHRVG